MTVAATYAPPEYNGNGVSVNFAAAFRYLAPQHLAVTRVNADGSITTLAYGPDFSATPGPTDAGGTVTCAVAPAAGTVLRIRRVTPRSQGTDYTTGDTFPAESHEAALDRSMLVDQEQDAAIEDTASRALLVPDGESVATIPAATARAGRFLAFDAAGVPIASAGTGNDPNFRTDVAAPGGAALMLHTSTHGASRGVNAVLDDMPWLDSFTGATDTLKWRKVITDQASGVRLPGRLMTVDLGTTPLAPTAPLTIEAGGGRDSPDLYNNSNSLFMQTLGSGAVGPITVAARGFTLRGNTAKANCGGFDLYDSGNGRIADMILKQFNKTTLRFKYGVNIHLDNLRIVGVPGAAAPVVELAGDGSAVGNGALINNVYITGGPTGFRVYRFRGVTFELSKVEYFDLWGLDAEAGDGCIVGADGLIFENDGTYVGNRPYRLTDFDLKGYVPGSNYGTASLVWAGAPGEDRFQMGTATRFAWAYDSRDPANGADMTAGELATVAGAWTAITFNALGSPYARITHTSPDLNLLYPGDYRVAFEGTLWASSATGREARLRARLSINGGPYAEIVGSDALFSVPGTHAALVRGQALLTVPLGSTGKLRWEVSSSNADLKFSGLCAADGTGACAAPTRSINRRMFAEYLGTVR